MERNEILQAIYGTRFSKTIIDELVRDSLKVRKISGMSAIMQKYSIFIYFQTDNVNTLKNRILTIKNKMKEAGVKDAIAEGFTLPTAFYTAINANAQNEVKKELLSPEMESKESNSIDYKELTCNTIDKMVIDINNGLVSTTSNNSKSNREVAYKKLIVVALATGRRQVEILKTLHVKKKKNEAIYSGLVKKKSLETESKEAPILYDINVIKKYIKEIREEFNSENLSNREINSKLNGTIGKALLRYLPDSFKDKTFHYLRAVYAEYCYETFANGKEKNLYFGEILSHEIRINPAHHYEARIRKGARR